MTGVAQTTEIAPTAPVTVLIVDDTDIVRLLTRHCLGLSERFDVVGEAVNGLDAIREATRQQPDIILLDCSMPVMGGLEALPHLARCSPQSIIIVLSELTAEAVSAQAMALGAHAYIEKRYGPADLLRRITDAWESVRDSQT